MRNDAVEVTPHCCSCVEEKARNDYECVLVDSAVTAACSEDNTNSELREAAAQFLLKKYQVVNLGLPKF